MVNNSTSLDLNVFLNDLAFATVYSIGLYAMQNYTGRFVCWICKTITGTVKKTDDLFKKDELASIIKIQSLIRGKLTRKAVEQKKRHYLNYSDFTSALFYTARPEILQQLPVAFSGKTPVYFPKDLPIVFKACGAPQNRKRFKKMKQARKICENNKYTRLVIPTARVYEKLLIESCLPLAKDPDLKVHYGFYLENIEKLTEAVKEFTGFLCQTKFKCITDHEGHYYNSFSKSSIGRYDNIAMYLDVDGLCKIGLIDLERFKPKKSRKFNKSTRKACLNAINLFPYHLEVIIKEALKFDPLIEKQRIFLEREKAMGINFFKRVYTDHKNFLQKNDITLADPAKLVTITKARKNQIKSSIEKALTPVNTESIEERDEETFAVLDEIFEKTIDDTIELLQNLLEKQIKFCGGKESITNTAMLLSARSIYFDFNNPPESLIRAKKSIVDKFTMLAFHSPMIASNFANKIIIAILSEMKKGEELAYFNPACHIMADLNVLLVFL